MKKATILSACLATLLFTGGRLMAQTYDTIYNRAENCYYNTWYDTCECFLKGQRFLPLNVLIGNDPNSFALHPAFTPSPMEVKGVMLFVRMDVPPSHYDYRLPEYALLYQYDAVNDTMLFIDSTRWDTLSPKIMKWPQGVDTALRGFYYCYAYEAYFDHPIMVDSLFYVGGTQNSNTTANGSRGLYKSVEYRMMHTMPKCGCEGVVERCWIPDYGWDDASSHNYAVPFDAAFGGFLPIVDKYRLNAETDDIMKGTVDGSGLYPNHSFQTITAIANPGYRFVHWNDGDTANPRIVHLTQDTTFTAFFQLFGPFHVRAVANDNRRGHVSGGGSYYYGQTAELSAEAYDPYSFVRWNDGDTANPRSIVVTQDTSFTAFFEDAADTTAIAPVAQAAALFTLAPNPATGKVTVEVKSDKLKDKSGVATLTLRDAAGHEVRRLPLPAGDTALTLDLSDLPAGAYFVTLATPTASSTQRLVVK